MRKPLLILLSILIFCLFAVLGFLTASNEHEKKPVELSVTGQSATAYQQNLLIIQIDRLDKSPPILLSVWIAGVFNSSNQTVVTFSQLYIPGLENSDFKGLENGFAFDNNGNPAKSFLNKIKSRGINWQGYAVVDEDGSKTVDQWLRSQGAPIFTPAPASASALLGAACQVINGGDTEPTSTKDRFDWNTLAPHLISDISADELQSGWKKLFSPSSRPTRCEMGTQ